MKNFILIPFLFLFAQVNAQYSLDKLPIDYTNQVLKCALKVNSLKSYNNVIVSELNTAILEYTLRNLKTEKTVFKSIDTSQTVIRLTKREKRFILSSFKKQYKTNWTNEDFANVKVIRQSQVKDYVKENKQNGYIYISVPIFIRNGTVAIVFFANLHGDLSKTGGGINNLSFYKLKEDKWEKWITLEAGIYN